MPSIGSGFRSAIVTEGMVAEKVYLDYAPRGTAPPYITYTDSVPVTSALRGDGKQLYFEHQLVFTLWMTDANDDPELVKRLRQTLNGMRVKTSSGFTSAVRIVSVNRTPGEFDSNLTGYEFTVSLMHDDAAL